MSNVVCVDGSWISHKSFHRAYSQIKSESFATEDLYRDALLEKSLELSIQTLSLVCSELKPSVLSIAMDVRTPPNGMLNCAKVSGEISWKEEIVIAVKNNLTLIAPMLQVVPLYLMGVEADSVGYWVSRKSKEELEKLFNILLDSDYKITLVTADYDWEICINEFTSLYNPMKKEYTTEEDMIKFFGTKHYRLAHIAHRCLTSNKDGIIGISGIGAKSSVLIRDYFYDSASNSVKKPDLDEVEGKREKKLVQKVLDNWGHFLANWKLVDEDWIFVTKYYSDLSKPVNVVLDNFCISSVRKLESGIYNDLIWTNATRCAGKKAKLNPAKARFDRYISNRAINKNDKT
ncbi:PIN domain-like protein [Vibrio phage Va2]|nr:PIN domain-like protein [Vibrio phage Va2]